MTMKPEGRVRILTDDGTQSPITKEYREAHTVQIADDMGHAHQLIAELYDKQIKEHGRIVQRYIFSLE